MHGRGSTGILSTSSEGPEPGRHLGRRAALDRAETSTYLRGKRLARTRQAFRGHAARQSRRRLHAIGRWLQEARHYAK